MRTPDATKVHHEHAHGVARHEQGGLYIYIYYNTNDDNHDYIIQGDAVRSMFRTRIAGPEQGDAQILSIEILNIQVNKLIVTSILN